MGRSRRVFNPILRAILLFFYWISSTAALENNGTSNKTDKSSNGSSDKPFSCEWKDLEFPITYGPGIAASLCIVVGGFHLILGEENLSCNIFIAHVTIPNRKRVRPMLRKKNLQRW